MKRNLFFLILLLLTLILVVSCQDKSGTTTATDALSSPAFSKTETASAATSEAVSTIESEAPEVTKEALTFPDVVYNTEPITGEVGEPLLMHWNPYLLSPLLSGNDSLNKEAQAMIKAIVNHRATVKFSSLEAMHAVCDNLFYEFPPSALCRLTLDDETLTVTITYRLARAAHLDAIAAFGKRVELVIADSLRFGDDEATKAILLYHEVSRSVEYFHVDYESWQTNAFYALTEGKSICYGFADAYNYLLRQVGIGAYLVKSFRPSDHADHGWSLVKLDGEYYHCDPTWESSAFKGEGFMYFGYTDSRRKSAVSLKDATIGEGALQQKLSLSATSARFEAMNGTRISSGNWTLDRTRQVILFKSKEYSYGN